MGELSRARIRLRVLADAAALAVGTFVLAVGLTTMASLHPGLYPSQEGHYAHGTATVKTCDRVGPLSRHGFGYWWRCEVEVALPEGRLVTVTVGRSIVSPKDAGRQVPFLEQCDGNGYEDCAYGRPGRPLLGAGSGVLQMLAVVVALGGMWLSAVAAYNALRGRRHWWRQTFETNQRSRG